MFLYFLFHLSHSTVIEFNKNYDLQNKSFSPLVIYCYKNDLKKGTKETIKQIHKTIKEQEQQPSIVLAIASWIPRMTEDGNSDNGSL